ncbi:hypothetical protein PVK06_044745 [Gossypium arboreum]|uniref:Uncharacterized protein n=1 Tax=Gossypium arboreum TaxID=29729 RepID=A0ABR0MS20_GOSAR|nr:hypothetical protein PVK06_044745 [Gossypium arboreum]
MLQVLQTFYELRQKWVSVYLKGIFAGISSRSGGNVFMLYYKRSVQQWMNQNLFGESTLMG